MSVSIIIEVTTAGNDQINTLYIIGTHDEVDEAIYIGLCMDQQNME
jgi:hypothetical protein